MVNSLVESTPPPGGKEENTPSFDVDVHFFFLTGRIHVCVPVRLTSAPIVSS